MKNFLGKKTFDKRGFLILSFAYFAICSGYVSNAKENSQLNKAVELKTWKIESKTSGGISGRLEAYTLESNGRVRYEDRRKGLRAETKADEKIVSETADLLWQLNLQGAKAKSISEAPKCCDFIFKSLNITLDDKFYNVETTEPDYVSYFDLSWAQQSALSKLKQTVQPLFTEELKAKAVEMKFDLGKQWIIKEGIDENYGASWEERKAKWEGILTRRGDTNVFDAVWRNSQNGETLQETVKIEELKKREIRLTRSGAARKNLRKVFIAQYLPAMSNQIAGNAEVSNPGVMWAAQIK